MRRMDPDSEPFAPPYPTNQVKHLVFTTPSTRRSLSRKRSTCHCCIRWNSYPQLIIRHCRVYVGRIERIKPSRQTRMANTCSPLETIKCLTFLIHNTEQSPKSLKCPSTLIRRTRDQAKPGSRPWPQLRKLRKCDYGKLTRPCSTMKVRIILACK